MKEKTKIVVILGPTATGKSDLAVELALWIKENKIGGYKGAEIISADSRQVYKGLDIGTGKITADEMRGIPHYCLDIADPVSSDNGSDGQHERFTVVDWKKQAESAVGDISARGKLPIVCGGTGFYISALIDGIEFPDVEMEAPHVIEKLKSLEEKSVEELFVQLQKADPSRAKDMKSGNGGDSMNKRRLIKALLIAGELGAVPKLKKAEPTYDPVIIGLILPDEESKKRIKARLIKRLDGGMIEEAKKLHTNGLTYERMDELGLEYRYLAKLLHGELTHEQLIETLSTKIWQYARRQKTWFKRDDRIDWFAPTDLDKIKEKIKGMQ